MDYHVELNYHEEYMGTMIGLKRQEESIKRGLQNHKMDDNKTDDEEHVLGSLGEIAVAQFLEVYWSGHFNKEEDPDIYRYVEVRTRTKHWYGVKVQWQDEDKSVFVLAICEKIPFFTLRGWIWGNEAKLLGTTIPGIYIDPNQKNSPAHFVPAKYLKDMNLLKKKIHADIYHTVK